MSRSRAMLGPLDGPASPRSISSRGRDRGAVVGDVRRLLILTLLDYTREPNGRIHHVIKYAQVHWDRVTVVHGTHAEANSLGRMIREGLRFRTAVREEGNLREVRIHPFLNTPEGLAKRITGYPGSLPGRLRHLRLGMEGTLNTLGVMREVGQMASLALAVRRDAPGPFDACVVQCPVSGQVGLWARRRGVARFLLYDDIDYAPGWCDHWLRRTWIEQLERRAMGAADAITCAGSLLAELRARQLGRPPIVIPNGADIGRFRAAREKVFHPPTLVYSGRVMDWAGLEVGFAALARAQREVPGLRFLVIGRSDPAYERRLREQADRLGVAQSIQWIGEVPYGQLPSHFRTADVGYAAFRPTLMKRYAFPLKVIEYMAAGLPVVGTLGTETERILAHHRCGEAVEHDPEAIARALVRLFHDRERYTILARNAAGASEAYGWESLMVKFEGAVAGVLNEGYLCHK